VVSYVGYLERIIWPFDLAVFYPHPGTPSVPRVAGALVFLVAMPGLIGWSGRRRPFLLVGWLWFAGTLLPVSGVLQAGWQGMADRFVYFPSIGLFLIIAFGLRDLMAMGHRPFAIRVLGTVAAVAVLVFLSMRTTKQLTYWQNSLTLWEHARRVTPDNFYTRFSYGAALLDAGRVDEAADQFVRSVELKPDHPFGHYELGLARREQGRLDEAIASWTVALRLAPDYTEARLALAAAQMGHDR
jgi:protein O-mannosyl-transferase